MKKSVFKKMVLFLALGLLQNTVFAQTANNQVPISDSLNKPNNSNVLNSVKTSESIPTPEDQGFTKVIVNGKVVYFKKVDGVIVEYKPE